MRSYRSFRSDTDATSLAGWLFADLLLCLGMIFLASNLTFTPAVPSITPTQIIETFTLTATLTSSPTTIPPETISPTLTFTPTSNPPPMDTVTPEPTNVLGLGKAHCYFIKMVDKDIIVSNFQTYFRNNPGDQVGLVIVWVEKTDQLDNAQYMNYILRNNVSSGFKNSARKSLYHSGLPNNTYLLEVYYIGGTSGMSQFEINCPSYINK